ncbi:MAG: tetratricopeptide repeat protein [Armatimonadota bacterium]|nr:tetratricopeptide repeat protein [Armatimonadota bacterium]
MTGTRVISVSVFREQVPETNAACALSRLGKALLVPALLACSLLVWSPRPVGASRPLLALYELLPADDSSKSAVADGTKFLKTYLRDLGKIDVVQVRSDMTSVKLAIAEGSVTQEEVSRLSDPDIRQKLAKALRTDYALGGAISLNGDQVSLAVELVEVQTGKKWQGVANISIARSDPAKSQTNAIQSVANTVVQQFNSEAFAALPVTTPATVEDTTPQPTASNSEPDQRAQRARQLLDSGNVAAAIYELRRATQSDPQNPSYRLLLAKAYIKKNMYDEAMRELNRVAQLDPNNDEVWQTAAELYEAKGTPGETITLYERMILKRPEDPRLRIKLGDLLWKKAKIDEAIKNFEAAAALDPGNVEVYDRLARCYAAKSQFDDSLKQLDQISKIETAPDPATVAARYSALMVVIEGEIKSLSSQFDQGSKAYQNEEHSREQYYELVRGLTGRADTLTRFLDKVTSPPGTAAGHAHRVLACSLLSQAGTSLMSYLETNREERQTESELYLNEAKKELALASSTGFTPPPKTPAAETAASAPTSATP